MFRTCLIAGCSFLMLNGCARPSPAVQSGFLEGHLRIVSPKAVELAEAGPSKALAEAYAEYPLVILSEDGKREIAHVIADEHGNYRLPLLPGAYVLDAEGRAPRHIRAKPTRFTVVSGQTVHIDFDLDVGVR